MTIPKQEYVNLTLLVERLHRRFLDVIKAELDALGIEDINNVQTLILTNIGDETLTIGELTNRGYYLGSNVSYNIKKLVESDFLIQERSAHDKRSVKVRLSEKGLDLCQKIDHLFEKNIMQLQDKGFNEQSLRDTINMLKKLELFWSEIINPSRF